MLKTKSCKSNLTSDIVLTCFEIAQSNTVYCNLIEESGRS